MSKVKDFRAKLQENYAKVLGGKLHKAEVLELFQATFDTIVDFVIEDPKHKLSLNNIGRCKIMMGVSSGRKKDVYKMERDPRLKFYLAKSYLAKVYKAMNLPVEALETVVKKAETKVKVEPKKVDKVEKAEKVEKTTDKKKKVLNTL